MYESNWEKTSLVEALNQLISYTVHTPPLAILELFSMSTTLNINPQMFG